MDIRAKIVKTVATLTLFTLVTTACGQSIIEAEPQPTRPVVVEDQQNPAYAPVAESTADSDDDDGLIDEDDAGWVNFEVEVLATNLDIPWELVFLPNGDVLITERPGQLRLFRNGELQDEPVLEFDDVVHDRGAEGGLLGMTLHPAFEENGWIYFYYTYLADENDDDAHVDEPGNDDHANDEHAIDEHADDQADDHSNDEHADDQTDDQAEENARGHIDGRRNRVVRYVLDFDTLEFNDLEIILDDLPGAFTHNGGRMKFGPDDKLYVTLGDAQRQHEAQDPDVLVGKILRLNDDGTIPDDNPFEDSPVFAVGLRNPQGISWHPETGELYASQHGPTGNDEINRIEPGANYGWPDMEGFDGDEQDDFTLPVMASGEHTWAPSGATFIRGDTFPQWHNELLLAGLRSVTLYRINFDGDEPELGPVIQGEFGRLRTVVEGPDGYIYILTSNRDERQEPEDDDDRLIRLVPK